MFENIMKFFKKLNKKEEKVITNSRDAAKERLHLVLMQDRANVSADFLELMKQEIIEVIKKYIDVDESAIDVRLTNKENEDGTNGAPALYANIPIVNIKNDARKVETKDQEEKKEPVKTEKKEPKEQQEGKEEENKDNHKENNKKKSAKVEEVKTNNKKESEKTEKKKTEDELKSENLSK